MNKGIRPRHDPPPGECRFKGEHGGHHGAMCPFGGDMVLPLHPRTAKNITSWGLMEKLTTRARDSPGTDRFPFFYSNRTPGGEIMTDSGGVQRGLFLGGSMRDSQGRDGMDRDPGRRMERVDRGQPGTDTGGSAPVQTGERAHRRVPGMSMSLPGSLTRSRT